MIERQISLEEFQTEYPKRTLICVEDPCHYKILSVGANKPLTLMATAHSGHTALRIQHALCTDYGDCLAIYYTQDQQLIALHNDSRFFLRLPRGEKASPFFITSGEYYNEVTGEPTLAIERQRYDKAFARAFPSDMPLALD